MKYKEKNIKQLTATHTKFELATPPSDNYILPDKTIDYTLMITYLTSNEERTLTIFNNLITFSNSHNLILTSRNETIEKLEVLFKAFNIDYRIIMGKTKLADRVQYENDFKNGKVRYLLSNYQLAKEGLDLPIADTLHLILPMSDKRTIVQSAGRVERLIEGKTHAIVIDYVDVNFPMLVNMYKERVKHLNDR